MKMYFMDDCTFVPNSEVNYILEFAATIRTFAILWRSVLSASAETQRADV